MDRTLIVLLFLFEIILIGCEKPENDPTANWEIVIPDTLSNTVINSICEYKDGSVWIGTSNGILVFFNDTVSKITLKDGLLDNNILDIKINSKGELLIFTKSGINRQDGTIHEFTTPGVNFESYDFFAVDKYDNIWMLGYGISSTSVLEISTDTCKYYIPSLSEGKLGSYRSLFADSNGKIWLGSEGMLFMDHYFHFGPLFSLQNGIFEKCFDENITNAVYEIAEDKSGNMWLLGDEALIAFNGVNYSLFDIKELGKARCRNSSICLDHEENPWITTNSTLMRMRNRKWTTEYTYIDSENILVDPSQIIRYSKIMEDSKYNLWVCTNRGVIRKSNI